MKKQQKKSIKLVCILSILCLVFTSCDILGAILGTEETPGGSNEPAVCTDENNDHLCDECKEPLSECKDENLDHKCDTCTKVISVCTEGENHLCSMCAAVMSVCIDEDRNHGCDICFKPLSMCADNDLNHECDVCSKPLSSCKDENINHECDICGKSLSECFDGDNDHRCDLCNTTCSECSDTNRDHLCEVCGVSLSECTDENRDHACDLCEREMSTCSDANADHKCDVCSITLSECKDETRDHFCDICKAKLTNCEDKDSNHTCDLCTQTMSICADGNKDHLCDVCSLSLSFCADLDPRDHACDVCDKVLSECSYENRVCTVCGDTTIYKHVVIVGVDGAGSFFKDTETPNMDAIFADGAITYTGITESPSISAQSWASLMHGVNCDVHGITANSVGSYPLDSPYPSFFRVIRENDPSAVLGSYTTWNTINNLIVEDGIGITKVGWSGTDADLTVKICSYIEASAPTALFIQFDNVDAAGHNYGFGSDEHLAKISETDALIGQIYSSYVSKGIIDDTLFIVTTDHGGTRVPAGSYLGNHGGETPEEKQITLAAKGKTVIESGTIESLEIRDTAAIVLYALGYEQPATWTARVPSGLFEGVSATDRPTPPRPDEKELTDYVSKTPLAHLTFDKNYTDATGNYETTSNGSISYTEGYLGSAMSINNSSVSLESFNPDTDTLTFATWVKVNKLEGGDPVLFANKSWKSGLNTGILVCIHNLGYIQVNVADGATRTDLNVNYTSDILSDWMHLVVVLDRESNTIGLSINFGTLTTVNLEAGLSESSLSTSYDLVIGQDGTEAYTAYLKAYIDDFIIFDGAFDQDDIASLATYYGEKANTDESYRNHKSEPTPTVGSDSYVTNYIKDKDLLAYLTFDNTLEDATGNYETDANKAVQYGSGFFGNAVHITNTAINIKDFKMGNESVTFTAWLNVSKLEGGDPVIFTTKSWSNGSAEGILVCIQNSAKQLHVNIANGKDRTDFKISYPEDMMTGWMHLSVVLDFELDEIRLSFDFGDFYVGKLNPGSETSPIGGAYDLVIGQDGTNAYTAYIANAYVDEFMVFDGAFTEDDLAALEAYYNQYQ